MSDNNTTVQFDEKKAQKLVKRIIMKESKNINTEEKRPSQMVNEIMKMIEEAAQCYS